MHGAGMGGTFPNPRRAPHMHGARMGRPSLTRDVRHICMVHEWGGTFPNPRRAPYMHGARMGTFPNARRAPHMHGARMGTFPNPRRATIGTHTKNYLFKCNNEMDILTIFSFHKLSKQ